MGNLNEKMMTFLILLIYYLYAESEASVIIVLVSFILFFVSDVFKTTYIAYFSVIIMFMLLILDTHFVYFIPGAIYVLLQLVGPYSIVGFIPLFLLSEWVLLIVSVLLMYLSFLSLKLERRTKENRNMRDQLTEDNIRLRAQRNELMNNHEKDIYLAGLNERNRIARDMHDALGHSLSSSILLIESLQFVNDEAELKQSLKMLQDRLKTGMNDIRHSIHHLYDTSIDIEARIEQYLSDMENFETHFVFDVNREFKQEEKIDILAIVRESLTNITKHSNGDEISVIIKEHPKYLTMTIKDNGTSEAVPNKGMGIQTMKEVVMKYGGVLNTFNDQGFTVHAIFYKEGAN